MLIQNENAYAYVIILSWLFDEPIKRGTTSYISKPRIHRLKKISPQVWWNQVWLLSSIRNGKEKGTLAKHVAQRLSGHLYWPLSGFPYLQGCGLDDVHDPRQLREQYYCWDNYWGECHRAADGSSKQQILPRRFCAESHWAPVCQASLKWGRDQRIHQRVFSFNHVFLLLQRIHENKREMVTPSSTTSRRADRDVNSNPSRESKHG